MWQLLFSLHKSNTKGVGFNKIIRRVHKNWYFKDVTWVKNLKWAHHCFFKKICPKTKLSKKTSNLPLKYIPTFREVQRAEAPHLFFFWICKNYTILHNLIHYYSYLMLPPMKNLSFRPPCLLHCPSLTSSRIFYTLFLRKFPRRHYFSFFSSFSSSSSNHPNLVFQWLTRIEITNHPNVRSKAFYGCSKSCEWQKT